MDPLTFSAADIDGIDLSLPRSCWTCHKRKVRCDKELPCSTCVRTGSECSYPELPEKKKRSKRLPASAILARLAHLERKINQINKRGGAAGSGSKQSITGAGTSTDAPIVANKAVVETDSHPEKETPGVLLSQGGQSRYFSDEMMASIAQNVKGFDPFSEEALLRSDKQDSGTLGLQSFPPVRERRSIPNALQAMQLYQIYLTNVDPLVKILHVPTLQPRMYSAIQNPSRAEDSQSMLLYSICFAAVVTMTPVEVETQFSVDKAFLSRHCRDCVEQYISKPAMMMAPNIEYLQALTIFLSLLRVSDNSRAVWILTGLALRIAQSLGLHKDGSIFRLPPFECEVRRRLWWQLIMFDIRAAEDYGLQSLSTGLPKGSPQYPGNFNDIDLSPNMTELPPASTQPTDMSLAILRIQASDLVIHEALVPLKADDATSLQAAIEEKRCLLRNSAQRMQDTHFAYATEDSNNFSYMAGTILWRLSLAKAEFLILFRACQSGPLAGQRSICHEAVAAAITILEGIPKVYKEKAFKRFLWYPKSYPQWYAIGFVLQQLYSGEIDDPALNEHARKAVEDAFATMEEEGAEGAVQRRGAIWVALCLLKEEIFGNQPDQRRAPEVQAVLAGVGAGSESGSAELTPESVEGSRAGREGDVTGNEMDMGLEEAGLGMDFDMANNVPFDMTLFETMQGEWQSEWGNINDYL